MCRAGSFSIVISVFANRFSTTCYLDSDGQPTCDNCPLGFTGRRCERYVAPLLFLISLFFSLSSSQGCLSTAQCLGLPGWPAERFPGAGSSTDWFHSQERDISMSVVQISLFFMVFVAEVYQRRDGISNISLRFCAVSSQSCWWFSVLYCGCFDLQIVKLFLLLLVVFFVPHATQTTKVISPVAQCCVFVVG